MSKRIFQATLFDPDVLDAGAETQDAEMPANACGEFVVRF